MFKYYLGGSVFVLANAFLPSGHVIAEVARMYDEKLESYSSYELIYDERDENLYVIDNDGNIVDYFPTIDAIFNGCNITNDIIDEWA
jgi:hypothetical protein